MTDWRLLHDAYGSAEAIEALLDAAGSDDPVVWDGLWSRLCHQGTVYTASYAAIPRLTELAESWRYSTFNQPFFLATNLIASTDGPRPLAEVREQYSEAIGRLHSVAERLMAHASDNTDFVYKLQALLATEGVSVWATNLEALADQELELECPQCREQLIISFEVSPATVAVFDATIPPGTVTPTDPVELVGSEAHAFGLAIESGRPELAHQMLDLFGYFDCPRCDSRTNAAGALN